MHGLTKPTVRRPPKSIMAGVTNSSDNETADSHSNGAHYKHGLSTQPVDPQNQRDICQEHENAANLGSLQRNYISDQTNLLEYKLQQYRENRLDPENEV
jgi:hypothetical protein